MTGANTLNAMKRPPEPWLRGTLPEEPAVVRAVLHALELAQEDAVRWCSQLTAAEALAHPAGLPSVAFQLCHMAGSLDRLLTYAEGRELDLKQLARLSREAEQVSGGGAVATGAALAEDFGRELQQLRPRVQAFGKADLEASRSVGRRRLPTSLGGLLVHLADHTQRHAGQLVTTAKVLLATRGPAGDMATSPELP